MDALLDEPTEKSAGDHLTAAQPRIGTEIPPVCGPHFPVPWAAARWGSRSEDVTAFFAGLCKPPQNLPAVAGGAHYELMSAARGAPRNGTIFQYRLLQTIETTHPGA